MGDTSGCQINSNNLAVYLQGVTVGPSSKITSEYFVTASLPSSASLRRDHGSRYCYINPQLHPGS